MENDFLHHYMVAFERKKRKMCQSNRKPHWSSPRSYSPTFELVDHLLGVSLSQQFQWHSPKPKVLTMSPFRIKLVPIVPASSIWHPPPANTLKWNVKLSCMYQVLKRQSGEFFVIMMVASSAYFQAPFRLWKLFMPRFLLYIELSRSSYHLVTLVILAS